MMPSKCFGFCVIFLLKIVLNCVSSQTAYNCSANASCGCSNNPAVLTKIVGGESAASQTWGWMASLRYSSTGAHFCGGSIISAWHILTGAHCVTQFTSASAVRVYVGSIYLSNTVQTRSVSKIVIHEKYSATTYVNDIAVLKLSSSLDLAQAGVDVICLPNVSSVVLASGEYPVPNTNLIAIGWGYLTEAANSVSSTLQQVTVRSVAANSDDCARLQLADSSKQLCAGIMPSGGKDTCQGDSGGPLMMFTSRSVWELVGITSSGVGCARQYYPGIYTRVAAFQTWINETINHANGLHARTEMIVSLLLLLVFVGRDSRGWVSNPELQVSHREIQL